LTDNVGEVLHGCFDFFCFLVYNYFPALTFLFLCFPMALLSQMHGSFLQYFYVLLLLCILTFEGCISAKSRTKLNKSRKQLVISKHGARLQYSLYDNYYSSK